MADEEPKPSWDDDNGNWGMIIFLLFAVGLPIVALIYSYFTETPTK